MNNQITSEATRFLGQAVIPAHINGLSVVARDGRTFDVENPSDGSKLATVSSGGAAEVDEAVRAAHDAFGPWARMDANKRAEILCRVADLIDEHTDTLAQIESLDVGKTISLARAFDIPFGAQSLRYFADQVRSVCPSTQHAVSGFAARSFRSPYGVCGFIFPWNFPFTLFMWGCAPALAAGNSVVVKPSGVTPLSTLFLCSLMEKAGMPKGVVNVVTGPASTVGTAMMEHRLMKRMSFTGSTEVGRNIGATCGRNLIPVKLELGGKGAAVVFDDVDVADTAKKLVVAVTMNTGQVCCTATRWFVHERIFDRFVEHAVNAMEHTKIGPALDPSSEMGPVVNEKQRQSVIGYYKKGVAQGAGALVECRAVSPTGIERGFYVTPGLLTGPLDNICIREEIFGPVAYVVPFKDTDPVVDWVNSSDYGLGNSVWTTDLTRANCVAESMIAGNNWINAHNVFAYGLPYGGCNLSGCGGGVNSREALLDYLRPQTIARPLV